MKRIARLLGSPEAHARSRLIATTWGMGAAMTLLAAASTALAAVRPTDKPAVTEPPMVEVVGQALPQYRWQESLTAGTVHPVGCEFAGMAAASSCESCHRLPQDDDGGVWVIGEPAGTEGAWVRTFEAGQSPLLNPVAGENGLVELTTEGGDFIRAAQVMWSVCPQQTIDPEKMPSDGLLQAAKLAYPYNLLQLMPWVAPEAHDVLVVPEVAPAPQTSLLLLHRARPLVMETPILLDLVLQQRAAVTTERVRLLDAVNVIQGEAIEVMGEAIDAESPVEVEGMEGVWQLRFEVEPSVVEFQGDVVIETAKPASATTLWSFMAARSKPSQPAEPAPKP